MTILDERLEEVQDRLAYYGEDDALGRIIVETIARLPESVADFALDRCRFTSVGESVFGMVLPGRIGVSWDGRPSGHPDEVLPGDDWIIVLAESLPPDDAHGIVAHEIAHAWRGDDRLGMNPPGCEHETAELVGAWGFSGLGADPEHCATYQGRLEEGGA